jgi:NADH:ubiquinone oxidoreductase subunit 3 (subunit A)
MLGLALLLIVLGIIGLFLFPWGGIVAGIVGVLLLIAFLSGFARRAQTPGP